MEIRAVGEVASLTGWNITNIRPGPDAQGIDVLFDLDGRSVEVQHTVLHPDEGQIPGKRGSPIRAKEEATARRTQRPFWLWGQFDFWPALRLRVEEKIAIAARHAHRRRGNETWALDIG